MNSISYIDCIAQLGVGSSHPGGLHSSKEILLSEPIDNKMKILDLGCGTGVTSELLAKTFQCEMYAIDQHPIMLEKAQQRFQTVEEKINLFDASIEQLPFEDESFDYVISESVLSFVQLEQVLEECYRVLKNDGVLIVHEMTLLAPLEMKDIETLKNFYQVHQILLPDEWDLIFAEKKFSDVKRLDFHSWKSNKTPANEIILSESIDPRIYDVLEQHEKVMEQYSTKIGSGIFRCVKKV
ncbi:class I SAM-dependent methyltransferase [Bacillus suaedae]|uniref:Class I SAM-dependent methyltransferase n=1 Tax=Halalkalibacter suaedae TaxID=2822140 RepID=A0A941APR2_9BACI|nr:class I SAM-dependent methyltransferase [Bacillus suaedae]MBP3950383.1 class I SAM-dependent methyltransferase [Bacillus suaedae]